MIARFVLALSLLGSTVVVGCSVDANGNPTRRCVVDADCPSRMCDRGFCIGQNIDGGQPDADSTTDAFVGIDTGPVRCESDTSCGVDDEECDGYEACGGDGFCVVPVPLADGTLCNTDEPTRQLCIAHTCQPTRCGDGFTDPENEEECDDTTDIRNDGCESCRFSCRLDENCDDGNECNGEERCTDHRCVGGDAPPDGTACAETRGTCMAESCVPNSCEADADCNDGNECNGVERCVDTECVPGAPMDCGDGNACTTDTCERGVGCIRTLMDGDGDGYATASCGGPDCDDRNPAVHPGAPEICDGTIDHNCVDGTDDEVDEWFADCDGDGFAVAGAEIGHSCTGAPIMRPAACAAGSWTARAPSDAANRDCNDAVASVFPGQTMYQTTGILGVDPSINFDYNCDTIEERRQTGLGRCSGLIGGCSTTQGWHNVVPDCGVEGQWVNGCSGGLGCSVSTVPRVQECR